MATNYVKRAFEILQGEGPVELSKKSTRFLLRNLLRPLDPQYHRRFKFYTWKNHLQNRVKYDAPPDPYGTIQIRPSEIDNRVGYTYKERTVPRVRDAGLAQTKSGDWDTNRVNIENSFIIKGITEYFKEGKEWKDTVYYNHICKKYSENSTKYKNKGYDNLDNYLKDSFNSVENLFDKIKSEGYKPNHNGQHVRPGHAQPVRDKLEVLVTIDRRGEINFYEGNHRFGISRVLNIEIPAHVVCRHKKWQELRDEIHNNGLPEGREDLRDHSDLQDILSV